MFMDEFKGFDYKPHDEDDEIILSEIPLNILMESIKEQFKDPSDKSMDNLQIFETRYLLTKKNMDEDNEDEVVKLYDTFVRFMRDMFKEYLSIGLPDLEDLPEGEQLQLIHYIYRYFILNIKSNFTEYCKNYIEKNKAAIAEDLPKKKDICYKTLKDVITDPDELTIISSLSSVVRKAITDDSVNVDEFIELSNDKEGKLENEFMSEKYENFNITGNFVPLYHKMLSEENRIGIECSVRNNILEKYRNNRKTEEVTESSDT